MELAKTNLERAKELYAADVVAKELLDTRNCEMLSSNAVLASTEAKVRNAKLNLEYTSIRAPMSGKISEALVDIGNLIVADSTLLTRIVDDSSVQAYFELSERDVVAYCDCGLFNKIDIKAGTGPTVSLRLFEHKDKTYNGVLNYYDNEISSESASLTMRADFDNSKRQLSLGMDVKKATKDTMDHVQNALIAITLVLSAFRPHGVCRRKRLVSAHQFARLLYAQRPKRRIPSSAHRHVQFVGDRPWNHLDLDLFGRIQSMVVKERALVQASYNLYCNLMLSIHARIASEYFFARQCESEIKLLSDTLKVRKIQTEFVQKRLSLKFASKLDLSRAKVLEYEAASQLDYVKRQLDAAKNRIALLCGRSATDFELKCAPLTDSLPNIPKVFPSQLLERRPDIAAAERNVYAANAQLGADTAAFFPTISITGDVGFKANRIENLLEAGSLAWGISPQLYIPIFQAGKLCAQKDADIAAHKEATEKYKSTVLGAIEEVETLLSDISHMNREYENRRQTSAHSADVQMYTQKQYELGDQDYFAVSDAQRQYLTYKREEIRLLGARYRSYVSLVMSLGGGWENKYENPSALELVNL